MIRRPKTLLLSTVLILGLVLASCGSPQAPQGAVEELHARWQSLPGSQTHDLVVLRAWPGEIPSNADSYLTKLEIWCFETQAAPKLDLPQGSERMVWLVTRSSGDSRWEAAPLMIFSSTWPYEACLGRAP